MARDSCTFLVAGSIAVARASIIIVSWNGLAYLAGCLKAVLMQASPDDEIIVVDNASTDGTAALIKKDYVQVQLIQSERNLGYGGGLNAGIGVAQGKYVLALNQDVQVHADWLAGLLDVLDTDHVGVAGCKLLYPDGKIQHAGGIIRWPQAIPDHYGYRLPDDGTFDQVCQVDYVTGAAWGVRRAVVEQIGLLDEGFWPGYFEEVDYCFRAKQMGWQIIYTPHAVGTHHESASFKQASPAYFDAFHRGRLRFVVKWTTPDVLQTRFAPAEAAWLETLVRVEQNAVRRAYRSVLRMLPTLLPDPDACVQVCQILESLYMKALTFSVDSQHQATTTSQDSTLNRLKALQTLQEFVFQSNIPWIGSLLTHFREKWNSISTKWYVRAIIQQQSEFNRQLLEMLQQRFDELDAQFDELDVRLIETDRDETATVKSLAELTIQITQINRRLAALEERWARENPIHE